MVQRYNVTGDDEIVELDLEEIDLLGDGGFVKYEDYVKLQQERDALQQLIQMAYDAPTSDEGMHWVHQGVNNLAEWMDR